MPNTYHSRSKFLVDLMALWVWPRAYDCARFRSGPVHKPRYHLSWLPAGQPSRAHRR